MPAGERGPMKRVLGVYLGILRMTVLLPLTLWRAWEITKSREFGDKQEVRDDGDDTVIDDAEESARFGQGVTFGEAGGDWIEPKDYIKAVKQEAVTKDVKNIVESQYKQIFQILERINKLEQEVNAIIIDGNCFLK
jgi:hypothetical protein